MHGFGIIGCGMISRFHAKAVADLPGAKVAACFDAVPAAAEKLRRLRAVLESLRNTMEPLTLERAALRLLPAPRIRAAGEARRSG